MQIKVFYQTIILLFFFSFSSELKGEDLTPDYVTVSYKEVININKIDDVTQTVEHEFIVNKPDCTCEQFVVHYGFLKEVKYIKGEILDMDGSTIKKIKKGDIFDVSAVSSYSIYEDSRVKAVNLKHDKYPYKVKVKYETAYKSTKFMPVFAPLGFSHEIIESSLIIYNHTNLVINSQITKSEFFTTIQETENKAFYQLKKVAPIFSEPNIMGVKSIMPLVILSTNKFQIEKHKVDNSSWQALGNFYYNLNEYEKGLSEKHKTEIIELTKSKKSEKEKVEAIYQYIQKSIRYVSVQLGIGGWKSFPPAYVEDRKYGDCKAMSCYLKACLAAINIPAHMMIINSSEQPDLISEEIVAPLFNHAIVYVPSLNMWLDPTQEYAPAGYIGKSMNSKMAIMLAKDTSKIIRSPNLAEAENIIKTTINTNLSNIAASEIAITINLSGTYDERFRSRLAPLSEKEMDKYLRKFTEISVNSLNDISYDYSNTEPTSELKYVITSNGFVQKTGKRMFIPILNDFIFSNPLKENKERKLPFSFATNKTIKTVNTITIPEGYDVEYLPESREFNNDFGTYNLQIKHEANTLTVTRTITRKHGLFNPNQYESAYQFFRSIEINDKKEFVLIKK